MRSRLAALAALLAVPLLCSTQAPAADIEAGRTLAEACGACHGPAGLSSMPDVPSLAGQRLRFLEWQLVFFRNGRRENPIMGPLSAGLSDEEVRNLAAYFASLPRGPAPAGPPDPALHEAGKAAASRHRCAACHMEDFGGSQAAPAILHQPRDYLAKALRDYRSGARPSVGVAAMTEAASALTDEEITALAVFLEQPG
ncbi:MAG TPA: c-type cytochrome [Crenalkalicoccus sp.]|nr:c-type cytochrome [Crenalkalicoccus sp.]